MFDVTGNDATGYQIQLSRGDTGAIRFTAHAKYRDSEEEYVFGSDDRAIFSIKDSNGTVVKEKVSQIVDNQFVVIFRNPDTDTLAPGTNYSWDVRYVINPYYGEDGRIIDGDQVITPKVPQSMNLISVVGDI